MEAHNAFAGQGSVLLDIGGDIGALVVTMPASMVDVEIEIRPVGAANAPSGQGHSHGHSHDHDHAHDPSHGGHPEHGDHVHPHHPHVAVVGRPTADGVAYTCVFPELLEGSYELYEKLGGPVRLVTTVTGGTVQEETWPG